MKRVFKYLVLCFVFIACDSDSAWDCVKTTGAITQQEITLNSFQKIDVRHRVQLVVKQGNEQQVVLETGENLRGKISLNVANGELRIDNENSCNLLRDYGITKLFVTSPNITHIRNGSGLPVLSDGVLHYTSLNLISEDTALEDDIHTVGDFELQLDVENLNIVANGKSNFFLSGQAERATIGLYGGDGRVEAVNLIVQDLTVFHRSSNKMIVNPQQSIIGEIRGVGDIFSHNVPPVVEVEEFYTGKLIFQ